MTYLQFHLIFILPPLLALAAMAAPHRRRLGARAAAGIGAMALAALAYTTPWDNYLVWRGIWSYGAGRVLGTVGYVPLEEYLFFLLQPVLTGLWAIRFLPVPAGRAQRPRWVGAAAWLSVAALGVALLRREPGTYLGLILAWAAPVLALQWAVGGARLGAAGRTLLVALVPPTAYLWMADALAIHLGIWSISPRYTLGVALGPLPLEEAVFFLLTNLLVVQGLALLVPPERP